MTLVLVQMTLVLVQMTLVLVQMGVVHLGVVQLGLVQLGVVWTGVDPTLHFGFNPHPPPLAGNAYLNRLEGFPLVSHSQAEIKGGWISMNLWKFLWTLLFKGSLELPDRMNLLRFSGQPLTHCPHLVIVISASSFIISASSSVHHCQCIIITALSPLHHQGGRQKKHRYFTVRLTVR